MKRMFHTLRQLGGRQFDLYFGLLIIAALVPVGAAIVAQQVVDQLVMGAELRAVLVLLALEAGLIGARVALDQVVHYLAEDVRYRTVQAIQLRNAAQAARLDLALFENPEQCNLLHRLRQDSYHRPVLVLWSLASVVAGLTTIAGFVITIAAWQPLLAALFLLGALPLLRWGQATASSVWHSHDLSTPDGRWAAYFDDLLCERAAAKEVRLFALAPVVLPRLGAYNAQQRQLQLGGIRAKTVGLIPGRLAGVAAQYGAVALAVVQVTQHTLSLGQLTLILAALAACRHILQGMLAEILEIQENRHYFADLFGFWDLTPRLTAPADAVPAAALTESIRLERVSFRYPDSPHWVLREVDVTIPVGTSLAIVGVNGAGKTTLIKLLARLYDTTEGSIQWDGTDIRAFDPAQYRAQLSITFQDFVAFQLSLKENITIGAAFHADAAWLQRVLGFVALDALTMRFRAGVDTLLGRQFGEHGEELSGGQWQRVAVARGLYRTRSASVLVLDEPTAAMDAEQEARLYAAMTEWKRDRTLILISHRLSSVRHCDQIIVLDNGRVAERGDHATLMRQGGRYRALFDTQASGYAAVSQAIR